MLQSWQPNSLPLPYGNLPLELPKKTETAAAGLATEIPLEIINIDDKFPKGRVVKYFPHQGYGFISDRNGKEIYFSLSELDFAGVNGKETLKTGSNVGYDASWTSHGMHVKRMKIY
jgi:cold shock CspA family protein